MKIGIVSPLPKAAEAMRRAVALALEHEVHWVASDSGTALESCARRTPDLVLMDLVVLDGVEAIRRIMAASPCAILVVTAQVDSNAPQVFDAIGHGALDAVYSPEIDPSGVLRSAAPLLQHAGELQARSLVAWLGKHSVLPVRIAQQGEVPSPGIVLVAGTDDHLTPKADGRRSYTREPAEQSYRPSVDVFFNSVSRHWKGTVVGVLLTGMGRDGALGLKLLCDNGHYTVAQDEATSAVFGMPKFAAKIGAAVVVLPLTRIAPALMNLSFGRTR